MLRITSLEFSSLDVPLLRPFGIATGTQQRAHNILVTLKTDRGVIGYGEGAPVEHISGERREDVLHRLSEVQSVLDGRDLRDYRRVSNELREVLVSAPSGLAAVEMAVFDAIAKHAGISLLQMFGARERRLSTDVTITTGSIAQAAESATEYAAQGFSTLKIKIGGAAPDDDVARLLAIVEAVPHARLILDGNTAFSSRGAIELVSNLGVAKRNVVLFEQPVERDDFEGLAEVEAKSGIFVAADESLRSEADFRKIVSTGGISAINIKTAKLGVLLGWDLLVAARCHGLAVMVGGMVETEMSMTTSACLAAGVGGVDFVDLDTPMLLGPRPLRGGFVQNGPELDLSHLGLGHGVVPLEG